MTLVTANYMVAFHDDLGTAVLPTSNVTAQAGYGLANLQNRSLWSRFRGPAGSLTGVTIVMDAGAAISGNAWALLATNLTTAATRRLEVSTVSNFASVVFDTGTVSAFDTSLGSLLTAPPPWGRHVIYTHTQDVTWRYARWTLTDAGNPDGFLEVAMNHFGMGYQAANGQGFSEDWQQDDDVLGPPGWQKYLRGHSWTLRTLSKADAHKLATLHRGILTTRRVLVLPLPKAPETWLNDAIWATSSKGYGRMPRERSAGKFYVVAQSFLEVDN